MLKPLVSIIIPTFNRAQYIGFALDSVIAQTYSNWECIVVDDGSRDHTPKIMADYCQQDSRISYYKRTSDYKKGVNGSRNFGLDKSKGTYIALCDDDDFWLHDKLEKQVQVFKQHPELGLVTGNIEFVNTDGKRTGRIIEHKGNHGNVFEDFMLKNRTSAITPLFKREVVDKVGNFNTDFKIFEDWEFWRRVAYYYSFYGIKDVLACVRLHSTNTSKIVTNNPLEQFIRYAELNKATLKWGKDAFSKKDLEMIKRTSWKRYKQILRNHCPGYTSKLKFLFGLLKYDYRQIGFLLYLFMRYEFFDN